ncbi:MAG: type II toxin-antitoxin system RelE/ParE family toxin [Planctomycetaceae bacterium]|nr:type II toxin-antitoxin system RelE/ParE family toxin [Planctomycetaceae bacterium]
MTRGATRRIRWKKAADDDLAEIVEHIAADSPQAAERFLDDLLASVESLARFPFTGSIYPRYPNARQLVFGNYVIYYTVAAREVMIRAVVHGARRFRLAWLRRK